MIRTFATLFTGGGGADSGLRAAGLTHLWGIEKRKEYAAIAEANGFRTLVQDVCRTDWAELPHPYHLHASPPCQRASVANPNKGEDELDVELAMAIRDAVYTLRPKVLTLENVRGYRRFQSCQFIKESLLSAGYRVADAVLDSADYGVPQNRKRLWLVASRVGPAELPQPTHGESKGQIGLFGTLKPYVGWEKALAGLTEPVEVELTERQKRMVPSLTSEKVLAFAWTQDRLGKVIQRLPTEVACTLLSGANRSGSLPKILSKSEGRVKAQVLGIEHMAALQGFPSNYVWPQSSRSERARCFEVIGNAVSPPIMKAIAEVNSSAIRNVA